MSYPNCCTICVSFLCHCNKYLVKQKQLHKPLSYKEQFNHVTTTESSILGNYFTVSENLNITLFTRRSMARISVTCLFLVKSSRSFSRPSFTVKVTSYLKTASMQTVFGEAKCQPFWRFNAEGLFTVCVCLCARACACICIINQWQIRLQNGALELVDTGTHQAQSEP